MAFVQCNSSGDQDAGQGFVLKVAAVYDVSEPRIALSCGQVGMAQRNLADDFTWTLYFGEKRIHSVGVDTMSTSKGMERTCLRSWFGMAMPGCIESTATEGSVVSGSSWRRRPG